MTHESIEEITMPFNKNVRNKVDRRSSIGGSDARIIMGSDEAALVRLWREKRGGAEPEDVSGNLIGSSAGPRRSSIAAGSSVIPAGRSGTCNAMSGIQPSLDGSNPRRHRRGNRSRI
jgi:hypothetical protein